MTTTVANEITWKLPDLDTTYHLEDHEPMTLGRCSTASTPT